MSRRALRTTQLISERGNFMVVAKTALATLDLPKTV